MLKTYAAVMLAGAAGTGLRLWLSTLLTLRYGEGFPLGTLVVNIAGCFIIGLVASGTSETGWWPASALTRLVIMTGFLGGFTTFSAFSLQTLTLALHGEWLRAGLNVLLSIVLCLAGVWLGHTAAGLLTSR